MRRLFFFLFWLGLFFPAAESLAWDEKHINFRDTISYVTDGGGEVAILNDSDTYPSGVDSDIGWSTVNNGDMPRDRDSGADRRLAGVHQCGNDGDQNTFRLSGITPGEYNVTIALGDASQTPSYLYFQLLDGGDVEFTIDDTNGVSAEGNFLDANGSEWSKSAWPSSNTPRHVTISNTDVYFKIGSPSAQSSSTGIAHFSIEPYSPPPTPTPTPTPAPTPWPCGVDLDHDGDVDQACPSGDVDGDGYTSSGSEKDCDDTKRYVYPGITTIEGCSAGQYKTCQSDGTFTACANISSYDPATGSGNTYWVDDAETDCSGAGTYADPEDYRCHLNSGMSGYVGLVAGDHVIFKCGTYNTTWSSGPARMLYLFNKDGTSSDQIVFENEPGCAWWEAGYGNGVLFDGQGTSPNAVNVVDLGDSDHVQIKGFEVDGTGNYSTIGIKHAGGTGGRIHGNYVHNIDGEAGDNLTCIYSVGTSNFRIDHNKAHSCYELADPDNSNNDCFITMDSESNIELDHNDCRGGGVQGYGNCIKSKHGGIGASGVTVEIHDNICYNFRQKGIVMGCIDNLHVYNNFLHTTGTVKGSGSLGQSLEVRDGGGGDDECDGVLIENNTIYGGAFGIFDPTDDYASFGNPAVTLRQNVVVDTYDTAYNSGAADGFLKMWETGSDADYTALVAGGRFVMEDNCFYNTEGVNLRFGIFGDNGSTSLGAYYTTYAALASAALFGTNYNEDPDLDEFGRAQSSNCSSFGIQLEGEGGGPDPIIPASATVAAIIIIVVLRRRRA